MWRNIAGGTGFTLTQNRKEHKEDELEAQELARTAVDMLEERQASEILLLDVRQVTVLADYFIFCTATSERQIKALAGDLTKQLKEAVGRPLRTEGEPASGWVLVDYGDVVIHLFLADVRRRYDLEELWKNAQTVVHIQ